MKPPKLCPGSVYYYNLWASFYLGNFLMSSQAKKQVTERMTFKKYNVEFVVKYGDIKPICMDLRVGQGYLFVFENHTLNVVILIWWKNQDIIGAHVERELID